MTRLFLLVCSVGLCLTNPLQAQGMQGGSSSGAGLGTGAAATVNINMGTVSGPEAKATANTKDEQAAEDNAATNEESKQRCVATCYNTKDAKAGCDVPAVCQKIEAETNYFSNIDKACKLPAGTAIKMGHLESTCSFNAGPNDYGYTGMFQFDTNSCKRGNLKDPGVQAQCMCEYTASSRAQYKRQNGGQEPSAGMYYLFHQQGGGCATKLAFGGNQSAAAVVQQCGRVSAGTALKRIACNLPGGCSKKKPEGLANLARASSITAQDFANIYLSKFNGIDNTNICAGGALPGVSGNELAGLQSIIQQQMAKNPFLAAFVNAAGGPNLMAGLIGNSGNLTLSGQPLNIFDVLKILGMEDTSGVYDDDAGKGYDTDDDPIVKDDTITFDITSNDDGSKTVKVTLNKVSRTHTVKPDYRMYVCDKTTINVIKIGTERDKELAEDTDCRKVTESLKKDEEGAK